jgi:hypothetical protein
MQIFVKTLTGKTITLEVEGSDTIEVCGVPCSSREPLDTQAEKRVWSVFKRALVACMSCYKPVC